jgi:S-adenosylmethionine synthetase
VVFATELESAQEKRSKRALSLSGSPHGVKSDRLLAHALLRRHKAVHETAEGAFLGPDAKAQVTISYKSGRPAAVDTVVLSTQHERGFPQDRLRRYVEETIIAPVLLAGLPGPRRVLLNPTDVFEIG